MIGLQRLALGLALLLAAVAPAGAVERIVQFISDVAVQRNGDLAVTETIQVEAEGNVIRRGIFRDFPTTYARPDGTRVVVGFDVGSVTRNGSAENFVIERLANGVRIRIGNADRTIPRGRHTYVIRYRTTRQIGFFADYDELYWNVTGNGWAFPIETAEARITLPEKVTFRQTALYTGPQGGRGKDATVVEQQPGRIVFRTTRIAAAAKRPDRCRRLAEGRGRAAHVGAALPLLAGRQPWTSSSVRSGSRSCSPITRSHGLSSAVTRRWAPSFRCSRRPTGCRQPPRASSTACRSTTTASPRPSSISVSKATCRSSRRTTRRRSRSEPAENRCRPRRRACWRICSPGGAACCFNKPIMPRSVGRSPNCRRTSRRPISASCSPTILAGRALACC